MSGFGSSVLQGGEDVAHISSDSSARGANGEWYLIPKNRESHAYPLDGRDNVSGTGHKTVQACVSAHMLNVIREVEAAEEFALALSHQTINSTWLAYPQKRLSGEYPQD